MTPFFIPWLIILPTATSSAGITLPILLVAIFNAFFAKSSWAFWATDAILPYAPGTLPKNNSTVCIPCFWVTCPKEGVTPAST